MVSEPSTIPVNGFENQSLNCEWLANTCGMRKCIRDHSSMRSFCRGVPVMSNLLALLKLSKVCHLWLFQFLIMWASSKIRYFHFFRLNILASYTKILALQTNIRQSLKQGPEDASDIWSAKVFQKAVGLRGCASVPRTALEDYNKQRWSEKSRVGYDNISGNGYQQGVHTWRTRV